MNCTMYNVYIDMNTLWTAKNHETRKQNKRKRFCVLSVKYHSEPELSINTIVSLAINIDFY